LGVFGSYEPFDIQVDLDLHYKDLGSSEQGTLEQEPLLEADCSLQLGDNFGKYHLHLFEH
jgi:hypothetical protein